MSEWDGASIAVIGAAVVTGIFTLAGVVAAWWFSNKQHRDHIEFEAAEGVRQRRAESRRTLYEGLQQGAARLNFAYGTLLFKLVAYPDSTPLALAVALIEERREATKLLESVVISFQQSSDEQVRELSGLLVKEAWGGLPELGRLGGLEDAARVREVAKRLKKTLEDCFMEMDEAQRKLTKRVEQLISGEME